jgi:hypothetical protein
MLRQQSSPSLGMWKWPEFSCKHLGWGHTSAQNAFVVTHFVICGNCGIPENMCWKETVLSQTIMDTIARCHKVHYNGHILCARMTPALLCTLSRTTDFIKFATNKLNFGSTLHDWTITLHIMLNLNFIFEPHRPTEIAELKTTSVNQEKVL